MPYNLYQNAVYKSPKTTHPVNLPLPHKASLVLLSLVVLALLAPYAGCNAGENESNTEQHEDRDEPSRTSKTTRNPSVGDQPLDQIEDILSN